MDEQVLVDRLTGLFIDFQARAHWVRDKWRRNRALYIQQALGMTGEEMRSGEGCDGRLEEGEPRTTTPTLNSTLENMLSDLIQMYPEAVFTGRGPEDGPLATVMTDIMDAVLERRAFPKLYHEVCKTLLVYGMGVVQTYWEENAERGKGDLGFAAYEPMNLFFDPMYEDIQDGRAVFKVTWRHMDYYRAHFPDKALLMREGGGLVTREGCDGRFTGDDGGMTPMLECWERVWDKKRSRYTVHMAKIAGGQLLDSSYAGREDAGMYEHGEYPFVPFYYQRIPGTCWGYGIFDYLAPMQQYINRMDQIILKNAVMSGKLKLLVAQNAGVAPEELADWSREIIEVKGNSVGQDRISWFQANPLSGVVPSMYELKINMMKEESGQNNAARGETGAVTAASAISLLQEAAGKRTGLIQRSMHDAFAAVVRQAVSIILEEYDEKRILRIRGEHGAGESFASLGVGRGRRAQFIYDLSIGVQRAPRFQSEAQNQLLLKLLELGALPIEVALRHMDFPNKAVVLQEVEMNSAVKAEMGGLIETVKGLKHENAVLRGLGGGGVRRRGDAG